MRADKTRFSKKAVIFIFVSAVIFTGLMIWVYCKYQSVPDTLINAVFSLLGFEGGFLAWIKTNEDKNKAE